MSPVSNGEIHLYPIRPYHERWQDYITKRNFIFNVSSISTCKQPKRSTRRLRNYFKNRKISSRFTISSIIHSQNDKRYYAKVSFLNFIEYGLLDSGANVSCIGANLSNFDFTQFPNFTPLKSHIKTADGNRHKSIGVLNVDVTFREQTHKLKFLIVPSISQRLILGLNFWKVFHLGTDILEPAIYSSIPDCISPLKVIAEISSSELPTELSSNNNNKFPLTKIQLQKLKTIISLFPSFEKQGLGRTSFIKHDIDVGEAKAIKQRFYPVSPAVEKVMYQEIDRMLALGVIEESTSAWSSPMRLVLKPNKVRLCLDARRLNQVTTKDAYPLPNIEGILSRLPKANIISKLDLKDAYWQIGLTDQAKALTAFTVDPSTNSW